MVEEAKDQQVFWDVPVAIQRADERLHGLQSNQDADARADGGDWMDDGLYR